jgi:Cof subfamily protein (haloacid dehalogenase superfamily)
VTIPRIIATDLDGTLLRSDSTLSDRTRAALRATRAAGVRVVAASARPARIIEDLFGDEDLIDTSICGNGAVRYEVGSHEIVITHPLTAEVTRQVVAEISRLVPGAGFAVETGHRVLFEPGYRYRPTLDNDRVPVDTREELLAESLVKLMVWLPDSDPHSTWARLRPTLGATIECTWSAERAPLEIAATGVSKAAALAALCEEWQVSSAEVIAFGDAPNDLPMLAWAGTAYAVANAHGPVLAATRHHTASNDKDGVAQVLERLFGGRAPGHRTDAWPCATLA